MDKAELLALYVDGQRFGSHHVLSAVGVDRGGREHTRASNWARR